MQDFTVPEHDCGSDCKLCVRGAFESMAQANMAPTWKFFAWGAAFWVMIIVAAVAYEAMP